ncbi:patatin [Spirochaetia bacterium]|nr:patatin [Spirochaetia bacterium]
MKAVKNFKWALVLSGGGAKGLAHIGILTALEKLGVPAPSLVAGTSMGAIVGGLYACGMKPKEIADFTLKDFDIGRYLDSFAFRISGPVGKVIQTGQILGSLATRRGIDPGEKILELLEKLSGGKKFNETKIPFRCNAVDLINGEEVIFDSGSVARAMRASMSFPAFFEPFCADGRMYVDGGLADNMPVTIARKAGFRHILAVDVGKFRTLMADDLPNAPQVVYRSMETIQYLMGRKERADLTIHATDNATPFSFLKKKELIELGERAVRESAPELESFFSGKFRAPFTRRRYRDCGIKGE